MDGWNLLCGLKKSSKNAESSETDIFAVVRFLDVICYHLVADLSNKY